MKENQNSSILYFILPQLLCILTYLLLVTILWSQNLATEHYWYAFIVLVFFYIPIYYLMFWYPKDIKSTKFAFTTINLALLIISTGIFFGIYFGIFYGTMKFNLHKIKDCQVIGKQSVILGGYDNYSILYVDFNEDGHNMLGYACLSSTYNDPLGTQYLFPDKFYQKNDYYLCPQNLNADSQQSSQRLLQIYRNRNLASTKNPITRRSTTTRRSSPKSSPSSQLSQQSSQTSSSSTNNSQYYCTYQFSNVKLPDWMCQDYHISYDDLIKKQDCYVHYFQGNSTSQQAYQNSKQRYKIKDLNEFALVTFNQLTVPLDQFMALIIFIFCPMIMSLNVIYNLFTQPIIQKLEKLHKQLKSYLYLPTGLLKNIQMFEQFRKLTNQSENSIKKTEVLNINYQGSPMISNENISHRPYLYKEPDKKPFNLFENNLQQIETNQIQLEELEFYEYHTQQFLKENKHIALLKSQTFQDKTSTDQIQRGKSKYNERNKVQGNNKQLIKKSKSSEDYLQIKHIKDSQGKKSQQQKIDNGSSSNSENDDNVQ